jgi:hypothetical protein
MPEAIHNGDELYFIGQHLEQYNHASRYAGITIAGRLSSIRRIIAIMLPSARWRSTVPTGRWRNSVPVPRYSAPIV